MKLGKHRRYLIYNSSFANSPAKLSRLKLKLSWHYISKRDNLCRIGTCAEGKRQRDGEIYTSHSTYFLLFLRDRYLKTQNANKLVSEN